MDLIYVFTIRLFASYIRSTDLFSHNVIIVKQSVLGGSGWSEAQGMELCATYMLMFLGRGKQCITLPSTLSFLMRRCHGSAGKAMSN